MKITFRDLTNILQISTERKNNQLNELVATLQAVSPLAVLTRGYSIISLEPEGTILSSAYQVEVGQKISAVLRKGKIKAEVKSKDVDEV